MKKTYRYVKATISNPHPGRVIPTQLKLLPTVIASIGFAFLATSVYPIVSYRFSDIQGVAVTEENPNLLSPISYEQDESSAQKGPVVLDGTDYTKASSWLPGSLQNNLFANSMVSYNPKDTTKPSYYTISIPSLGILEANVALTDEDLTKTLVHYPQTALPGEYGSPVIFGHSTLPQFFDPKNYKSIFSTLPKIKSGSDVLVNYGGIEFHYKVAKTFEVKPNDLWVLGQDYSRKTLKIITCVPPGTTIKRLIVEADLVRN